MKRLPLVVMTVAVVIVVTAIAVALVDTRSDSGGLTGSLVYADQTSTSSSIWRANPDGTHPVRLTNGSNPTISPNGRFVAFVRVTCMPMAPSGETCSDPKLFVMTTSDGKVERIKGVPSADDLAWAPDSERLAVTGAHRIDVFDLVNGAETLIAKGRFVSSPSFSPDGRSVVYERDRYSSTLHSGSNLASDLYVSNLESGRSQRITRLGDARGPAWGPSEIAFGHNREIWLINSSGSRMRRLASKQNTAHFWPSVWSADGKRLLLSIAPFHGRWKFRAIDVLSKRVSFVGSGNPLGLSRDGKTVLVNNCAYFPVGRTLGRVETVPLRGGRARAVVPRDGICQASWNA